MVCEGEQAGEAEAKTAWPEHFLLTPVDDIYELLKPLKAFEIDPEFNRKKKTDEFDDFIKGFVDFISEKPVVDKNRIKDLVARFFSFADIYVSVLIVLYKRMDKKSALQHKEQVANVFNFLSLIPLPSTKMYTLFERDDELISTTTANVKIQYERVWLKFVSKQDVDEMSTRFLKQLLPYFTQKVIDELPNAPLFADFLFGVFNRGDVYAVWSLGGIFKLMVNHNFEYPDFYQAIYKMTTAQICYAKFREEFFDLLNIFLSSSHIPMYIAAAFAKKLARLLLLSKLSCQEPLMSLIRNILVRHHNIRVLLERKEPSQLENDPYDENELNMQKCGASQSSLWELKTLQAHWNPDVSKRANFVDRELQPSESFVRWRDDDEYFAALLERKFGKQKAAQDGFEPQAKRGRKLKQDEDDDSVPTNFVEPDGSFFTNSVAFTYSDYWAF